MDYLALANKTNRIVGFLGYYDAILTVQSFKYLLLHIPTSVIEDGFEGLPSIGIYDAQSIINASDVAFVYNLYTNFTFQPGQNITTTNANVILPARLTDIGKINYFNALKAVTKPTVYITANQTKVINYDADIARWLVTICQDESFAELLILEFRSIGYNHYLLNKNFIN